MCMQVNLWQHSYVLQKCMLCALFYVVLLWQFLHGFLNAFCLSATCITSWMREVPLSVELYLPQEDQGEVNVQCSLQVSELCLALWLSTWLLTAGLPLTICSQAALVEISTRGAGAVNLDKKPVGLINKVYLHLGHLEFINTWPVLSLPASGSFTDC